MSAPRNFGAVGVAAGASVGAAAASVSYSSARDAVREAAWGTEEPEEEEVLPVSCVVHGTSTAHSFSISR